MAKGPESRYFDAKTQAEFLYGCVEDTVNKVLPEEVKYLTNYSLLNDFIRNFIDMSDKQVNLLIRFLTSNHSKLSKRALKNEFKLLTEKEVRIIEGKYQEIFECL